MRKLNVDRRFKETFAKALALLISAALVWTSSEFAQAAALPSTPPPLVNLANFTIPGDLGMVSDAYRSGNDKRFVFIIQDLHIHPPVQKKIRDILDFLFKAPQLKDAHLVGVEGAAGKIPTMAEASRPNPAIKRKIADYLIEQGELTGAEAYAIEQGRGDLLWGVENDNFYQSDRKLYVMTLQARKELRERLEFLDARLANVTKHLKQPESVKEVTRLEEALNEGMVRPSAVLRAWLKQGADLPLNMRPYPRLRSLAQVIQVQEQGQHPELVDEARNFISVITPYLMTPERRELEGLAKSDAELFYLRLAWLARERHMDTMLPPTLRSYAAGLAGIRTFSSFEVGQELLAFVPEFKAFLAQDKRSQNAFLAQKSLRFLIRYLSQQATDDEVVAWSRHMQEMIARVKALGLLSDQEIEELTHRISNQIDFYSLALVRNEPMVDNLLNEMKRRGASNTAVLIAGGFHARGITDVLRKQGVSYIVISPFVEDLKPEYTALYEERLADNHLSTDEIEQGVSKKLGLPIPNAIQVAIANAVRVARVKLGFDIGERASKAPPQAKMVRSEGHAGRVTLPVHQSWFSNLLTAIYDLRYFFDSEQLTRIHPTSDKLAHATIQGARVFATIAMPGGEVALASWAGLAGLPWLLAAGLGFVILNNIGINFLVIRASNKYLSTNPSSRMVRSETSPVWIPTAGMARKDLTIQNQMRLIVTRELEKKIHKPLTEAQKTWLDQNFGDKKSDASSVDQLLFRGGVLLVSDWGYPYGPDRYEREFRYDADVLEAVYREILFAPELVSRVKEEMVRRLGRELGKDEIAHLERVLTYVEQGDGQSLLFRGQNLLTMEWGYPYGPDRYERSYRFNEATTVALVKEMVAPARLVRSEGRPSNLQNHLSLSFYYRKAIATSSAGLGLVALGGYAIWSSVSQGVFLSVAALPGVVMVTLGLGLLVIPVIAWLRHAQADKNITNYGHSPIGERKVDPLPTPSVSEDRAVIPPSAANLPQPPHISKSREPYFPANVNADRFYAVGLRVPYYGRFDSPEAQAFFESMELSDRDREIVRQLYYTTDGKPISHDLKDQIAAAFQDLWREGDIRSLKTEEVVTKVKTKVLDTQIRFVENEVRLSGNALRAAEADWADAVGRAELHPEQPHYRYQKQQAQRQILDAGNALRNAEEKLARLRQLRGPGDPNEPPTMVRSEGKAGRWKLSDDQKNKLVNNILFWGMGPGTFALIVAVIKHQISLPGQNILVNAALGVIAMAFWGWVNFVMADLASDAPDNLYSKTRAGIENISSRIATRLWNSLIRNRVSLANQEAIIQTMGRVIFSLADRMDARREKLDEAAMLSYGSWSAAVYAINQRNDARRAMRAIQGSIAPPEWAVKAKSVEDTRIHERLSQIELGIRTFLGLGLSASENQPPTMIRSEGGRYIPTEENVRELAKQYYDDGQGPNDSVPSVEVQNQAWARALNRAAEELGYPESWSVINGDLRRDDPFGSEPPTENIDQFLQQSKLYSETETLFPDEGAKYQKLGVQVRRLSLTGAERAMWDRIIGIFDRGVFARSAKDRGGATFRTSFRLFEGPENTTVVVYPHGDRMVFYINRRWLQNLMSLERAEKAQSGSNEIDVKKIPLNAIENESGVRGVKLIDSIIYGIAFHEFGHFWGQGKTRGGSLRIREEDEAKLQAHRGGTTFGLFNLAAYWLYREYAGIPTDDLEASITQNLSKDQRAIVWKTLELLRQRTGDVSRPKVIAAARHEGRASSALYDQGLTELRRAFEDLRRDPGLDYGHAGEMRFRSRVVSGMAKMGLEIPADYGDLLVAGHRAVEANANNPVRMVRSEGRKKSEVAQQLDKINELLKSKDFALEMANWLDGAYYRGQGQTPPPFISPEEETKVVQKSAKEEKIAINLAGFYAVEAGIGAISERTGQDPISLLQAIVNGSLGEQDMLLIARFANATWKAGQPFRSLDRITRDTFRPAALLTRDELKKDFDQIKAAAEKMLEKMKDLKDQSREAQLSKLDELLKSKDFALEMATWLDGAYYRGQGQTPPPFIGHEEATKSMPKSVKEEKIAMNLAGFYAVESGIGLLAETTGKSPRELLSGIVNGTLSEKDMLLIARFANATWKAGQPFRSLDRITRDTFRPAALLTDSELKKDFDQIKAAAQLLLEKIEQTPHAPARIENVSLAELSNHPDIRALVNDYRDQADAYVFLSGGASNMSPEDQTKLMNLFTTLPEVAKQVKLAVGDGATKAGIMEAAGHQRQASGNSFLLLGVAPAGRVTFGEEEGKEHLDPNHSHVVTAEGDKFGSETPLMYELFGMISKDRPSVTIVANGGGITLKEVAANVAQGRLMIVIKGSGRAADMLVKFKENPTAEPASDQEKTAKELVSQNPSLFIVFDLNSGSAMLAKTILDFLRSQGNTGPRMVRSEGRAWASARSASSLWSRLTRIIKAIMRPVLNFIGNIWNRRLGNRTVFKSLATNTPDIAGIPLPVSTSRELGEVADQKTANLTLAERAQLLAAA